MQHKIQKHLASPAAIFCFALLFFALVPPLAALIDKSLQHFNDLLQSAHREGWLC